MTKSLGALVRAVLLSSLALSAVLLPAPASSSFERVGPTNEFGFPAWYQDHSGLVLEFCNPLNAAELEGGWCLLLPGDTTLPEQFPAPFADEHFWWAGDAGIDFTAPDGSRGRALLVLGLEAAFAVGPVVDGDQIAFGRIRVRLDPLPYDGTYTIYHPYGVWTFENQVAGERLFFTEDIGISCKPGDFTCALDSKIGPFLLPSSEPGGGELAAVSGPVPGKLYIADPARVGPVTGSPRPPFTANDGVPRNHNIFRIEGPNGFALETHDFVLMGRVYTGSIPGRVSIDRASYTSSSAGARLDVFATAFPTMQGRIPPTSQTPAVQPVLAFYPAPCAVDANGAKTEPAGVAGVPMYSRAQSFWGQGPLAAIPTDVCVEDYTARDATGQVVPTFFQAPVVDQVTIASAVYDASGDGALTVQASSSAGAVAALELLGFGDPPPPLESGSIVVSPLAAPPAKVKVRSSEGGIAEAEVTTTAGSGGAGVDVPVAAYDEITIAEDSGAVNIPVLDNDTYTGTPTVTITGAPRLGIAVVSEDGSIGFTPFANVSGLEGIAYTVTASGQTSSPAYVTIHITPVNDPPTANPDGFTAVAGQLTALDVLANDVDVDGKAGLEVQILPPLPSGVTSLSVDGQTVNFTAPAGTYQLTYQIVDPPEGYTSSALVTVAVAAQETISFTRTEFRSGRLRVEGTVSPAMGQQMEIYATASGSSGSQPLNGGLPYTAASDTLGVWALDARGVALPAGTTTIHVQVTGAYGGTANASFAPRR